MAEQPYFLGAFGESEDDSPDTMILVCVPVLFRNPDVPGTEVRCVDCSTEVALADSSKPWLAEHPDTIIVCATCGEIRLEEEEPAP